MEPESNFNLEQVLDDVVKEVEKKHPDHEKSKAEKGPEQKKQTLHKVVGEKLGKPQPSTQPQDHIHEEEKSYENPELKPHVDALIKIAFEKNFQDAVEVARKQDNPALLDAFHDALTDHFYDKLVHSGKIKT